MLSKLKDSRGKQFVVRQQQLIHDMKNSKQLNTEFDQWLKETQISQTKTSNPFIQLCHTKEHNLKLSFSVQIKPIRIQKEQLVCQNLENLKKGTICLPEFMKF